MSIKEPHIHLLQHRTLENFKTRALMLISPINLRNTKVILKDWWLIRASNDVNGKILAVGGFTDQGENGILKFSSAPIVKKHDARTLQSADGVTVFIEGSINEIRSLQSGITSEVSNLFWHGFPYNWDDSWLHRGEQSIPTDVSCPLSEQNILTDSSFKDTLSKEASKVNLQVDEESSSSFEVEHHTTELTASETECGKMDSTKKADECMGSSSTRSSSRLTHKVDGHSLGVGSLASSSSKEASKVNLQVEEESSSPFEVEHHTTELTASETECDKMDNTKKADECMGSSSTRSSSRLTHKADGHSLGVGSLARRSSSKPIPSSVTTGRSSSRLKHNRADGLSLAVGGLARCSSRAIPSGVTTDSKNVQNPPFEARRSNRVKISKDTHKQEKATNKVLSPENNMNLSSTERNASIYDAPLEESSHDDNDKPEKSQSKAKRRLEFTAAKNVTPVAKDDSVWLLSPVESICKRSRSGRLILPPLDFWRNQRAVYDMDRECVGVLNGLPPVESLARNSSEPSRKRRKMYKPLYRS